MQGFQPITRQPPKIVQGLGGFQKPQTLFSLPPEGFELADTITSSEPLRTLIPVAPDHSSLS